MLMLKPILRFGYSNGHMSIRCGLACPRATEKTGGDYLAGHQTYGAHSCARDRLKHVQPLLKLVVGNTSSSLHGEWVPGRFSLELGEQFGPGC
jgi:hypothetical protein